MRPVIRNVYKGLSILVVDDEVDVRELMEVSLEQRGARVFTADRVARAFELLEGFTPDLIISDIGMPGEDGVVFIRKLRAMSRERGGQIPAIAVSAFITVADRARAMSAGFDQYLHKPLDLAELEVAVYSLLRESDQAIA